MIRLRRGTLDLDRDLFVPDEGGPIRLSTREAALLRHLVARPQRAVSQDELLREVWGAAENVLSRAPSITVTRLRAKLEVDPKLPDHILTVHGEGFRFEPLAQEPPPSFVAVPEPHLVIELSDRRIDLRRHLVEVVGGRSLPITRQEATLLRSLLEAEGAAVDRDTLARKVWKRPPSPASIDNAVSRLRAKVEVDPAAPRHLLTVRGTGLRWAGASEPTAGSLPRPALPLVADQFVGRTVERETVARTFQGGGRLVTLVGPGGVGKTRLALELANTFAGELKGGTWFVDLANATDRVSFVSAVASGLRMDVVPERNAIDALAELMVLRQPFLVILDNLEQCLDAARAAVDVWHVQVPALRILATSRRPLGVRGEREVDIGPLALDDACHLFCLRAEARFREALTSQSPGIVEVCRAAEGLPLALELAAAHVRTRKPADIARALTQDPHAFEAPAGVERHRSLWAALDWSWSLLDESGRRALVALSVFKGGAPREAARTVLGIASVDAMEELVLHSLARFDRGRFVLSVHVARFAEEHGSRDERAAFEGRHRRWYVEVFQVIRAHHRLLNFPAWDALGPLWGEQDNLLMALERALASDQLEDAAQLYQALDVLWIREHTPKPPAAWLAMLVGRADELGGFDQGRLLCIAGEQAVRDGRYDEAQGLLARACDEAEAAGDLETECKALSRRAGVLLHGERFDGALKDAQERVARARRVGDLHMEGIGHQVVGDTLVDTPGRWMDAEAPYQEALRCLESVPTADARARVLSCRAALPSLRGNVAIRTELLERMMAIARRERMWGGEATARHRLLLLHLLAERFDLAENVATESIAFFQDLGLRASIAMTQMHLGIVYWQTERLTLADETASAACASVERTGPPTRLGLCKVHLAGIRAHRGEQAGARTLLREARGTGIAAELVDLAACHLEVGKATATERARHRVEQVRSLAPDAFGHPDDVDIAVLLVERAFDFR